MTPFSVSHRTLVSDLVIEALEDLWFSSEHEAASPEDNSATTLRQYWPWKETMHQLPGKKP